MGEFLSKLPAWAGNIPAWSMLVIVIGYIMLQHVKNRPAMEQMKIDERLNIKTGYLDRIKKLEQDVLNCRQDCDKREEVQNEKIAMLQTKLNNEALQRVQSEISLVSTLIQVVEAPQLKLIMEALEARQLRLTQPEMLGGAAK